MIHQAQKTSLSLMPGPSESYEAFLSHLGQKALASVVKHVELCESDAALGYGHCWKRMAGTLGALAPHATEALGSQVVKFYIPDGKYRKQVFALVDMRDGLIHVYLPDVLALAVTRKVLKAGGAQDHSYHILGDGATEIALEIIDADTTDVPPYCRPMLGWGRRAIRTTLPALATEGQGRAVERLCELAAEAWAQPA